MTREEFTEKWRYHLAGIMFDAATVRTSEERALFFRNMLAKLDQNLGTMYDQLKKALDLKAPER